MPYEPLHHKYRPKTFAELVGQEAIATTLTNAINTLKIAPAYLFTGPRGTGKTSSARILAKSLNCLDSDKPTPQPCGKCDVCQGISKGATLDVIEIDAASNTGVDNIREIIEKAQFAPVQCRYKVYVVDECHMLSTQAFNALLKTLEEPPLHVVFVLATTDPQRVLPTIISRCQRFDFRRIPIDAMVQHLSNIATKENINITKEAVTLVAQVAQGGLRDAQSLLDQLGLLSQEVTPEKVWDLVGSVSEHDLLDLLKSIISDNSEAVIDCTRKILDRGREPLIILQNLASFYRDLLIAKTAPNRNDLVACTQVIWEVLVDVAQNLEISPILYGQQHLRTAEVQIKNTTQPRLWLEITLLGLLPSAITIGSPAIGNQQNLPLVTSNPPKTNHPATTPPVQQTPPFVRASHPPVEKNAGIPKQGENGTTRQQSTSTPSNPSTPNHSSSPPHLQQQGEPPQRNGSSTPQQLQQRKEPPQNSGSSNPQQLQQVSEPFEQQRMGENTPFPSKSGDDADNSLPKTEQVQQTSGSSTSDYSSPPQQTPAQPDVNQVWQQVLANFVPVRQRELLRQMCYLVDFDGSVACVAVKGAWYEKVKKEQSKILTAFQVTFNHEVKVNIEKANAPLSINSKKSNSVQATPKVQQKPPTPSKQITPQTLPKPSSFPTPEKKQPPQISTPLTQSPPAAKNTAPPPLSTPQLPQTTPTAEDPEADELMKAAQRLAQALDGEIIQFTEENTEISDESIDSSELEEVDEEDIEF